MTEKPLEPAEPAEPKQKTLRGYDIPVPKRGVLMDAFRKIVQTVKKP